MKSTIFKKDDILKAILEFNLPEDQEEFKLCNQASSMSSVLFDFKEDLRTWLKHGHTFKTADEALERINNTFYEHLNEKNIEL